MLKSRAVKLKIELIKGKKMAQQILYDNTMQTTVDFSTVENGHVFVYGDIPCVKIDKKNPNYQEIKEDGTGESGKLDDTDQNP